MNEYLAIAAAFLVACTVPIDGCFQDDGEPSACQMLDWHRVAYYGNDQWPGCKGKYPATKTDNAADYDDYYKCLAEFFAMFKPEDVEEEEDGDDYNWYFNWLFDFTVNQSCDYTYTDDSIGCLFDNCKAESDKCGANEDEIKTWLATQQ